VVEGEGLPAEWYMVSSFEGLNAVTGGRAVDVHCIEARLHRYRLERTTDDEVHPFGLALLQADRPVRMRLVERRPA
jgi:hypothetical protein